MKAIDAKYFLRQVIEANGLQNPGIGNKGLKCESDFKKLLDHLNTYASPTGQFKTDENSNPWSHASANLLRSMFPVYINKNDAVHFNELIDILAHLSIQTARKYYRAINYLANAIDLSFTANNSGNHTVAMKQSKPMFRFLYLPEADTQLTTWANNYADHSERHFITGSPIIGTDSLSMVGQGDTLYIAIHGRATTPDEVAALVADPNDPAKTIKKSFSATELANRLVGCGLRETIPFKIKLLACWAGLRRKPTDAGWSKMYKSSRSFGELFYAELLRKNYDHVILDTYTGAIDEENNGAMHGSADMRPHSPNLTYTAKNHFNSPNVWSSPIVVNEQSVNQYYIGSGARDSIYTRLSEVRVRFGPKNPWPSNLLRTE